MTISSLLDCVANLHIEAENEAGHRCHDILTACDDCLCSGSSLRGRGSLRSRSLNRSCLLDHCDTADGEDEVVGLDLLALGDGD